MEIDNLLKTALSVSNTRAQTISSNIANLNTPDYKAKRVEFENLLQQATGPTKMVTDNPRHIGALNNIQPQVVTETGTQVRANGNNVDLDTEMVDQAQNGIYYNMLVGQLNGRYQMMSYIVNH
ncbi:flagellar basal body rod protein FlgB [Periweissella fabalis]|uniref:Flagellar basal body rod protein FlgB n=1 Tax=Periweissella fabalis TaxID=1070421 RepID=A0A7X6N507_9LACO|nr:flagellar basal body rod protein FlgB [Periweissella fabalis]MCM0599921.1 flagellar basal body rod protein FlgB [Periweissella fabalis]NKZ24023.1 flagellar basal body rod protein FlgB [Periweissella fabalis]